jgi:hypothetical protein
VRLWGIRFRESELLYDCDIHIRGFGKSRSLLTLQYTIIKYANQSTF